MAATVSYFPAPGGAASVAVSQPWLSPHYNFDVASTGSDTTGDGTAGNPWATKTKARDFIRANAINTSQPQHITVNVKTGTYTAPLALASTDSGRNGYRVEYRVKDGPGTAVLDGGTRVTAWSLFSGSVYRASIGTTPIYTVYENGIRSTPARFPKLVPDATYPMARAPYFRTVSNSSLTVMKYTNADMTPDTWTLGGNLKVTMWPGGLRNWLTDTGPVTSQDTTAKTLTMTNQQKFLTYLTTGSRYFVHGVIELLTQAGEWFHDTSAGFLYYWPRDGAIASQEIVIPTTKEMITLTGTSASDRCSNVVIDGFEVKNTDFVQWYRNGYAYDEVTIFGPGGHATDPAFAYFASIPESRFGAIHLKNTDHVTVSRCHVKCVGMHGLYMEEYGQSNTIQANWIEKCGLSGIRADGQWPGEGDILKSNTYTNLRVNNIGELSGGSSGIELAQTGSNTVSYSYIYNCPRKGIWIFADSGALTTNIYSGSNTIDHVKVYKANQDSGDTGAFGVSSISSRSGGPFVQNTFTQCIVDNIHAHSSMTDAAPDGFFCDDETWNQILTNCQATDCAGLQFRLNNSGGPILTNCSFLSNGLANGSFNATLMDTANIGTTSLFPYA